jgi:hypothetical protein
VSLQTLHPHPSRALLRREGKGFLPLDSGPWGQVHTGGEAFRKGGHHDNPNRLAASQEVRLYLRLLIAWLVLN